MKLSIVFPVLGQHDLATVAIKNALQNSVNPETTVYVVDNGNDYERPISATNLGIIKPSKNLGVYPVFDYAFKYIKDADLIAFLHSDLIVVEKGFDERIIETFLNRSQLGLLGFVGSNEIDFNGGRGGGTTSNFQGNTYQAGPISWIGSPADHHGMRNEGFTNAAVVDGCAMVVRREAWNQIGNRLNWPPHHFYDRLISTQMLEHQWRVGVLGVACDHISGQTVSKEERYGDLVKQWCQENGVPMTHNFDDAIYREAERRWLYEYRQEKKIVPIHV